MNINVFIENIFSLVTSDYKSDYQSSVFTYLQDLIQFNSAGWGESVLLGDQHIVKRACLFNIPDQFMTEYNQYAHQDSFAPQAFSQPGVAVIGSVEDLNNELGTELSTIIIGYDIYHAMAIFIFDPVTKLYQNIHLWRQKSDNTFDYNDKLLFEKLAPSMTQALRQFRHIQIIQQLISDWRKDHCLASCDEQGLLHDIDDNFIGLLQYEWPTWNGPLLPEQLIQAIQNSGFYRGKRTQFSFKKLEDYYAVIGSELNELGQLSEREYYICRSYANGESYKSIAATLSIAPATVRNHIANIYTKLSVRNKKELRKFWLVK